MANLEETRTGEVIGGRYLVGPLLGRGGHGEVYRARDTIDQFDVAIKFLAPHLAKDSDYRVRLVREARIVAALKGLATVSVHGVIGAEDGTPCVVMELMEGMDFAALLTERQRNDEPLSIDEVLTVFAPIVRTLDAAHARGIVHRDIKPSNIFLADNKLEDARIMDFGLAKAGDLSSITADQMVAGSPSYIAPEIWEKGAKEADSRSDIYSLAVVIFEAFCFEVPIYHKELIDMFMAVTTPGNTSSLFERRPSLPASVDDWVQQALATDPENRFQTVVAMWRALRFILES